MRRSPKPTTRTKAERRARAPLWLSVLGAPAEGVLSHAVRRLARARPDVFQRLGPYGEAIFHIAPDELPVAFQLRASGTSGRVKVKRRGDTAGTAAVIKAPLADLLGIFDGSLDADAAFFGRRVMVEGRTDAVVALHNTLEAAELSLADLLGGGPAANAAARALAGARRFAGQRVRRGTEGGA